MLHRIVHRLRQVAAHATTPAEVDLPDSLQVLLTCPARKRFRLLSLADQRHLVDVATQLADAGASTETVTAGLLHDIGKASVSTSIRLHHRVTKVLIERTRPQMLDSLRAHLSPPRGLGALWILANHARLGSELVASWGYGDRVVWLIAHHESRQSADDDLRLLFEADSGRLRPERARMLPYG